MNQLRIFSTLLSLCLFLVAQSALALKVAVIPDTQGRDDTWGMNRVLLPNGERTHLGTDWNHDGYYDGEGYLIDIGAVRGTVEQPLVVLDDIGDPIRVNDNKDYPFGFRLLPQLLIEPMVDRIIKQRVDVVLAVGDLTDLRTEAEYQQWMDLIGEPLRQQGIAVFPVRGNHEIVDGKDWLGWFDSAANPRKRKSVNNLDNGIDPYQPGDHFDQGYKLYQAYAGRLVREQIETGDAKGYPGIEELVYYSVQGNVLFVALDFYFSDLLQNSYKTSWQQLYPWLQSVLKKHRRKVDHIIVFGHEPMMTKKRPHRLASLQRQSNPPAAEEGDKAYENNLFGVNISQIGMLELEDKTQPGLADALLALFSEYGVTYISGHDHQYARSWIHAESRAKLNPGFMHIIAGNASWKSYNNRFGVDRRKETGLYQDNFVKRSTGTTSKVSFLTLDVDGRELSGRNEFIQHNFDQHDMSRGWRWDTEVNGWRNSQSLALANWQQQDSFRFKRGASQRLVGPRENYAFVSAARGRDDSGRKFVGTEAAIYEGYNLTFNSYEVVAADSKKLKSHGGLFADNAGIPWRLDNHSELLSLSWYTDTDPATVSDVLLIDGLANHDGRLQNTNGEAVAQSVAATFADKDNRVRRNRSIVDVDSIDPIALALSAPVNVALEDLRLVRLDEISGEWRQATDAECLVDTAYSDDFSVVYGKQERGGLPSGVQWPEGVDCRLRLWGYNHNNHSLWAMVDRQGKYSLMPAERLSSAVVAHPNITDTYMAYSHNSYVATAKRWQGMPIAEQLDSGIRILELDVWNTRGTVAHDLNGDPQHCDAIGDCLAKIQSWSDQNSGHSPIVVLFEITQFEDGVDTAASFAEAAAVVRGKVQHLIGALAPLVEAGKLVSYQQSLASVESLQDKFLIAVYRKFNTQLYRADYPGASPRRSLAVTDALGLHCNSQPASLWRRQLIDHGVFLAPRWLGRDARGTVDQDWIGEAALRAEATTYLQVDAPLLRVVKQDSMLYQSARLRTHDFVISNLSSLPTKHSSGFASSRSNGLGVGSPSVRSPRWLFDRIAAGQGTTLHCSQPDSDCPDS